MHSASPKLSGVGLRAAHYRELLETETGIGWLEVHPENYFCGGMHAHMLRKASERYPLSFHAVGLSLGSTHDVSEEHLSKFKILIDRFNPVRVSDHASWSASGNAHLNDLLPLPYNKEGLDALCRNIECTQDYLKRQILIENPSTYISFAGSTMDEPAFLIEAARRTGCGLLLDINNIHVQANNHGLDACAYINRIPSALVHEIHLAGHVARDIEGTRLLIDTHSEPVCPDVWSLYSMALDRFGPVATLIEWDKDLPSLAVLAAEADKAEALMTERRSHAVA